MGEAVYRFGRFRLDAAKRELRRDGAPVDVPARAFVGLLHLIEHRERAIARAELIEACWHRDNVSDTQLFQLILRARRLVGDDADVQHSIRTIPGFGYRWVAPTEIEPQAATLRADAAAPTGAQADRARPPSAAAGEAAAAATDADVAARPPRRRRPWLAAAALAVAAAAVVLAFLPSRHSGIAVPAASPNPRTTDAAAMYVAVLPLRVDAAADAAWVRLGGMDLVADRLRRAGLAVQPSEATLGVVGAARSGPGDDVARLRRVADIGLIVAGAVERRGPAWNVDLRADADGMHELHASASDADLMAALRGASDTLLTALGRSAPADAIGSALAERVQRVRAALLADDPERAAALIEDAPESMRGDGELRLLHAQIEERRGHFDAAEAELTRLLADVRDGEDDAYLHVRALITRGSVRLRLDRGLRAAKDDFDAALAVPGAGAFVHAVGDAYVGRGAVGTLSGDYAAAASDLGRARALLGQSGDLLAVARVDLELALLDSARGAAAEAGTRFEQAARRLEAFGAMRPLKSALIGLQDVQFDQLQNRAALATSDRAWTLAAGGDPLLKRVMALMRARILLANGRLRELHALIAEIENGDQAYLAESRDAERLRLLRVQLALTEGRAADAAREAAELPAAMLPGGGDDVLRAKAALWRQRARPPTPAAPGEALAPSAAADAGTRAAAPYRRLAEAERARALGRRDDAERAYRDALDLAEAGRTSLTLATVVASYADALIEQRRLGDAAAVAGRVGAWAEDDFDCAVVGLRLAHALGERGAWEAALANARRLAGERALPAALAAAPTSSASG
ncbi:MAG TPA: winged helix-turn-helix domain-containing protein [Dokdonella sp.]